MYGRGSENNSAGTEEGVRIIQQGVRISGENKPCRLLAPVLVRAPDNGVIHYPTELLERAPGVIYNPTVVKRNALTCKNGFL